VDIEQDPDEQYEENMNIADILAGLGVYPSFQIELLQKRRKKSEQSYSSVFVEKIIAEIRETETTMQRAAADQGEEEEWTFDNFANLDVPSLCQLVGTFMPIVKLKKDD